MSEVKVVPRGLLVDWGGVLTSGLEEALRRWAELDGFDFDSYLQAVLAWLPAASSEDATAEAELNPVHALERGQIAVPDFERKLASILVRHDGTPVPAEGLIER
ncbi:MAG TPA: HAD family phosphatase, partial [Kribbella sp.]|nr:HAD family phosphatase [Kribbella sp.]